RRRAAALGGELAFVLGQPARHSTLTEATTMSGHGTNAIDGDVPFVRYTEVAGRARSVVARPLEVDTLLQTALGDIAAVFTSATLAVSGSFSHVKGRLGLQDSAECLVPSPFDYAAQ